MPCTAALHRRARGYGEHIGAYAAAVLDHPLPWTKMRQVYRLLGLVRRHGADRVEQACQRALDAEAVNVGLIDRMLTRGLEAEHDNSTTHYSATTTAPRRAVAPRPSRAVLARPARPRRWSRRPGGSSVTPASSRPAPGPRGRFGGRHDHHPAQPHTSFRRPTRPTTRPGPGFGPASAAVQRVEVSGQLKDLMRRLKLGRLLDTLPERLALARTGHLPHHEFLEMLFADEVTRRDQQAALCAPGPRTWTRPWRCRPGTTPPPSRFDRQLWAELCSLRFLSEANNVLVLGPVGVGKTFLANALGHAAVRRRYSVHIERADKLFKRLRAARLDNTHEDEMRKLHRVELLIIDDLALQPLDASSRPPTSTS